MWDCINLFVGLPLFAIAEERTRIALLCDEIFDKANARVATEESIRFRCQP